MATTAATPGLRERKRQATQRAIQLAVLKLAADRGIDKVTVDEISREALISPRTFFNYYASKEAAVAGEPFVLPDGGEVQEFLDAGPDADVLQGLGTLLIASVRRASNDVELQRLRRSLLRQNPQLFGMRMSAMYSFERELAAVVERRLVIDDPRLDDDPREASCRALLITMVAMAAVRHAWAQWTDSSGSVSLVDWVRGSFELLGDVSLTAPR